MSLPAPSARVRGRLPVSPATLAVALGLAAAVLGAPAAPAAGPGASTVEAQETDPFLWLEEVEGERAMGWVEARNAETREVLEGRPLFDDLFTETLEILGSEERIAYPSILGDRLYNFWQDREHPRGIWRRTTWESYLAGEPAWETVLDVDALSEDEGVTWSFRGVSCLPPENRRCLVSLSRGGADATEVREMDLETGAWVEDGFRVPESKNSVAWVDGGAVLVATDFGEGSLTTSGYPRQARRWERGEALEDAEILLEIDREDMGVWVASMETADEVHAVIAHLPTIFTSRMHLVRDGGLRLLEVPDDANTTLVADQLVVHLISDWEVEGRTYGEGSVLSVGLDAFLEGGRELEVVDEPGPRSTIRGIAGTRSHLLVSRLDEVRGELWRYAREGGRWVGERVPAPELGNVSVTAADSHTDRFFFTYSTFTQPTTLYLAEEDGAVRPVRRMPAMFDAEGLVVEQQHATSRDGTRVPYFIVHAAGMELDGSNPTLLYGYGGFQVPLTPSYSAVVGKAWLERGGVYVVANIRGGGEFGPSWWRAALKENRQRAYDDFLAVAEDLVERGVTSPDHLGIQGGSNGGLLVGVAMTQRPELFDAVVIQVPLLDMRRYHTLLAGASWMAEYGNPDDPEDWAYIGEYSPYQNLSEDADYPVPLFTTTTRDDRVHPGHARKMAARMEAMGHPVRYFENTEGGHGSGVTPEQQARMYALTWTYLWGRLGDADAPVSEGF